MRHGVAIETDEIGDEQEEPAEAGGELARLEREAADIGDGFGGRADAVGTLLVEATREGREALLRQDFAHRGDAECGALLLERLADLVDRVVALAQPDDLLVDAALLRLRARSRTRRSEELGQLIMAKGGAEHAESAWRVAEPAGDLAGRQTIVEIGAQGLVLALPRQGRLGEEAATYR